MGAWLTRTRGSILLAPAAEAEPAAPADTAAPEEGGRDRANTEVDLFGEKSEGALCSLVKCRLTQLDSLFGTPAKSKAAKKKKKKAGGKSQKQKGNNCFGCVSLWLMLTAWQSLCFPTTPITFSEMILCLSEIKYFGCSELNVQNNLAIICAQLYQFKFCFSLELVDKLAARRTRILENE